MREDVLQALPEEIWELEPESDAWPPEGAELVLEGVVLGEPRPAGSKHGFVVRRGDGSIVMKDGRPVIAQKDMSGRKGETWRSDVRDAVLRAYGANPPLDEPLALSVVFYAERPKGHYRTGKNAHLLRPTAPRFPHEGRLPDGTKLARAFEDALNKLVWQDDRRFVDFRWSRRFGQPRAEYRLYRLPKREVHVASQAEAEQLPV